MDIKVWMNKTLNLFQGLLGLTCSVPYNVKFRL